MSILLYIIIVEYRCIFNYIYTIEYIRNFISCVITILERYKFNRRFKNPIIYIYDAFNL